MAASDDDAPGATLGPAFRRMMGCDVCERGRVPANVGDPCEVPGCSGRMSPRPGGLRPIQGVPIVRELRPRRQVGDAPFYPPGHPTAADMIAAGERIMRGQDVVALARELVLAGRPVVEAFALAREFVELAERERKDAQS